MIHVRTPSRLHFGLIAPAATEGRRFGGVGLMVEDPGIELSIEDWEHEVSTLDAEGEGLERLVAIFRQMSTGPLGAKPRERRPFKVRVRQSAPEHVGLGSGTQLALAVARALAEHYQWPVPSSEELACWVGRGQRSALGIHGFERGGFLVDGGKRQTDHIAPPVARIDFPNEWPIVLVVPEHVQGLHGEREWEAFGQLDAAPQGRTDQLCRLVLLGLLPALVNRDFAEFAEHLHRFNQLAGEAFRAVQGGGYASPRVHEQVEYLRGLGVKGVGQSSWGPCVFVLTSDAEQAAWVVEKLQGRFGLAAHELLITKANNQGARLWTE